MNGAQLSLSQVCDFPRLVYLFQVNKECSVVMSRSKVEADDGMSCYLRILAQGLARIGEQAAILFRAVWIDDRPAQLRAPAVLSPVLAENYFISVRPRGNVGAV